MKGKFAIDRKFFQTAQISTNTRAMRNARPNAYGEPKNFPTREQTLQACATAKTGYDEFPELPAVGPPSLTQTVGTPVPANHPRGYALQVESRKR